MAHINIGDTFADGQQVTGARLNQLLDSATLLAGAITSQPQVATNALAAGDYVLVTQGGVLSKALISDLLTSTGIGVINLFSINQINGQVGSSANLQIGSLGVICNLSTYGSYTQWSSTTNTNPMVVDYQVSLNENALVSGAKSSFLCNYAGLFNIPNADARFAASLTIPVGNTGARPNSPLAGNVRLNTDINSIELYDGSNWITNTIPPKIYFKTGRTSGATGAGVENLIYQTPTIPTIPSTETWTYKVEVFVSAGYTTGSTRPDGTVPFLNVYKNSSLQTKIQATTNDYGSFNTTYVYSFTASSGDVWVFKHYSGSTLISEPSYVVTLNKVQTATISDASTCI